MPGISGLAAAHVVVSKARACMPEAGKITLAPIGLQNTLTLSTSAEQRQLSALTAPLVS